MHRALRDGGRRRGPDHRPGRRQDRGGRNPRVARGEDPCRRAWAAARGGRPAVGAADGALGPMDLWEIRAEIPGGAAEAAELVLLESGCVGWTLLEDAVARRAWVVGIFESRAEAESRWSDLGPGLAPTAPGSPVTRRLPDADWALSYRRHFKSWAFGRL